MKGIKTPGSERSRLASAGARAVTTSALGKQPTKDRVKGNIFMALLLLAVTIALLGLTALVVQAIIEGGPRFNLELFTNPPSSLNVEDAGFRPALIGTLYLILGVIVLIVPLGVGSAVYLEEYADGSRWWNRMIELNIQNLAGVPSILSLIHI